jgi:uncharacterized protein YecE (DUF72 family)
VAITLNIRGNPRAATLFSCNDGANNCIQNPRRLFGLGVQTLARDIYPEGLPQKRWFECYAEEFDTVEINASFCRLPLASTFEGWREKAPPGVRYAVEVNRFITHMKKLLGCKTEVDRFIALARPLGDKLGPLAPPAAAEPP